MIHGFVQQSGGQARIQSAPGLGTTICLCLPPFQGAAEIAVAPVAQAVLQRAEAGQAVLIVDDEATVRMLVADVLEELGYASVEAANGPAALRVLETGQRIDLLITDVGLPGGINGRELAELARTMRPGLQVLFVTGYARTRRCAADTPGTACTS